MVSTCPMISRSYTPFTRDSFERTNYNLLGPCRKVRSSGFICLLSAARWWIRWQIVAIWGLYDAVLTRIANPGSGKKRRRFLETPSFIANLTWPPEGLRLANLALRTCVLFEFQYVFFFCKRSFGLVIWLRLGCDPVNHSINWRLIFPDRRSNLSRISRLPTLCNSFFFFFLI